MRLTSKKPVLRFPQFTDDWGNKRIDEIVEKVSIPVKVDKTELYQQIGIRSHGKGIFHKELVYGEALGDKRVFWVRADLFVVNIVFAWEQAVAKTTKAEVGMIASHRFPMFKPIDGILNLDFLLTFFLTKTGKLLLEMASPGGAGRNKTLGQKEFEKLKINLPSLPEQEKISAFLREIDEKIRQLTKKKDLLEQYKKGVMQQIFNQEIRFKDDNGNDFADWKEKRLGEVTKLFSNRNRKIIDARVYSVTNSHGFVLQSEHFDKEVAGSDLSNYKIIKKHTFAYNPARINVGSIAYFMDEIGIISSLYVCFSTAEELDDIFLLYLLDLDYIKFQISNLGEGGVRIYLWYDLFALIKIKLPSLPEQQQIANFLSAIDEKINLVDQQIEKTRQYKKGLLQQMFA